MVSVVVLRTSAERKIETKMNDVICHYEGKLANESYVWVEGPYFQALVVRRSMSLEASFWVPLMLIGQCHCNCRYYNGMLFQERSEWAMPVRLY